MEYLLPEEYESHGLSAGTPQGMVGAASVLINAHCRRESLMSAEHTERFRVGRSGRARLTYLPLNDGAVTGARARYGSASRCFDEMGRDIAGAFQLPGSWIDLGVDQLEVCLETGEVDLRVGALGLAFDEVEITYTAGLTEITESVKHACAMVVRNVLATPALNVKSSTLDKMHMDYFSDSLIDSNVKKLLAPYVAQKVG